MLKTLKDLFLDSHIDDSPNDVITKIKAEAVKWVIDCGCEDKVFNTDGKLSFINRCIACERTMKMNDITEEDLK